MEIAHNHNDMPVILAGHGGDFSSLGSTSAMAPRSGAVAATNPPSSGIPYCQCASSHARNVGYHRVTLATAQGLLPEV